MFVQKASDDRCDFSRNISDGVDHAAIPHFVRFESIAIDYCRHNRSIEQNDAILQTLFGQIRSKINGSRMKFHAQIHNQSSCFPECFNLLDYIGTKLLPNFTDCQQFEFDIQFISDKDAVGNFIADLLQMDQIRRSSSVLLCIDCSRPVRLPTEIIANWFDGNFNQNYAKMQMMKIKERVLRIKMGAFQILNKSEMIADMKKVFKIFCSSHLQKFLRIYSCYRSISFFCFVDFFREISDFL